MNMRRIYRVEDDGLHIDLDSVVAVMMSGIISARVMLKSGEALVVYDNPEKLLDAWYSRLGMDGVYEARYE